MDEAFFSRVRAATPSARKRRASPASTPSARPREVRAQIAAVLSERGFD
jgi:hypothetical protein